MPTTDTLNSDASVDLLNPEELPAIVEQAEYQRDFFVNAANAESSTA